MADEDVDDFLFYGERETAVPSTVPRPYQQPLPAPEYLVSSLQGMGNLSNSQSSGPNYARHIGAILATAGRVNAPPKRSREDGDGEEAVATQVGGGHNPSPAGGEGDGEELEDTLFGVATQAVPISFDAVMTNQLCPPSNRHRSATWSEEENQRFSDCLQQFGTDFSMIVHMFPGRSRKEILARYKKLQRTNPDALAHLLAQRKVSFPIDEFERWKKRSLDHKK
eukprot:PhF_6_TR41064/c0_g1_i1/m.62207